MENSYTDEKGSIYCPDDGLVANNINELKILNNLIFDKINQTPKKGQENIYKMPCNDNNNNNININSNQKNNINYAEKSYNSYINSNDNFSSSIPNMSKNSNLNIFNNYQFIYIKKNSEITLVWI